MSNRIKESLLFQFLGFWLTLAIYIQTCVGLIHRAVFIDAVLVHGRIFGALGQAVVGVLAAVLVCWVRSHIVNIYIQSVIY